MQRLFIFAILLFKLNLTAQVSFEATTDARQVLQGSGFSIRFELKNAEGSRFTPPDFEGFAVLSGPMRSIQTSIINGVRSSSIAYVYELQTNKLGKFTIGSASIVADNRLLKTNPVSIEVLRAEPVSESEREIFILASLDKEDVYVGEQCILSYKLFTRVSIDNIEAASRPSMDAFHDQAVNMLNNPVQREIYKGREYTTRVLYKTSLFPIRTGRIVIEPAVYRIVKGDRDPFGFGMPSLFQRQLETVVTNQLELNVKELPQPQPEGFSGAVGEMFLKVNPLRERYSMQDAIKIHLELIGNSNFLVLKGPEILNDGQFEVSDSKKSELIKLTDEPEIVKSQTMDFLLIPHEPGSYNIIPRFCFFDPKEKNYKTLGDTMKVEIVSLTGANTQFMEDQIQFPNVKPLNVKNKAGLFSKDILFWYMGLLPVSLLIIGLYLKRKKQISLTKSSDRISDNSVPDEFTQLERQFLDQLNASGHIEKKVTNLVEAKSALTVSGLAGLKASSFLHWIYKLELIKYAASPDAEKLAELKRSLDELI